MHALQNIHLATAIKKIVVSETDEDEMEISAGKCRVVKLLVAP
jgi:hypothetical protein